MTDKERIAALEAHVERLTFFQTHLAALMVEQRILPAQTLRTALDDTVGDDLKPDQDRVDALFQRLVDRLQH